MKELIAKLLQIKSRGLASGINEAQKVVDEEFNKAYVTSVGYKVGSEVPGTKTLSMVSDFEFSTVEGSSIIQQNSVLGSQGGDVVKDLSNDFSFENFERHYVGTPVLNCNPVWVPQSTSKNTSDFAKSVTGQNYKGGYMFDLITVAAPVHYENMLNHLNDNEATVDVESELDKVRK